MVNFKQRNQSLPDYLQTLSWQTRPQDLNWELVKLLWTHRMSLRSHELVAIWKRGKRPNYSV